MRKAKVTEEEIRCKLNQKIMTLYEKSPNPTLKGLLPLGLIRQYKHKFDPNDWLVELMMQPKFSRTDVDLKINDPILYEFFHQISDKKKFIERFIDFLSVDFMNKHRDLFVEFKIVSSPRIPEDIIREIFEKESDPHLKSQLIEKFRGGLKSYQSVDVQYSEEFASEMLGQIDILEMARYFKLSECFIREHAAPESMLIVIEHQELSEAFLEEILSREDIEENPSYIVDIFEYQKLSEEFVEKYKYLLPLENRSVITRNHSLSEDYIIKLFTERWATNFGYYLKNFPFSEKVLESVIKNETSKNEIRMMYSHNLTEEFIMEHIGGHIDRLGYNPCIENILENNHHLSENFLKEFMIPLIITHERSMPTLFKSREYSKEFVRYLLDNANPDIPYQIPNIIEYIKIDDIKLIWRFIEDENVVRTVFRFCILSNWEIDAIIKIHPNSVDGKIRKVLSRLTFSMNEDIALHSPCEDGAQRYLSIFKADERISWNMLLEKYPRKHIDDTTWLFNNHILTSFSNTDKIYGEICDELIND